MQIRPFNVYSDDERQINSQYYLIQWHLLPEECDLFNDKFIESSVKPILYKCITLKVARIISRDKEAVWALSYCLSCRRMCVESKHSVRIWASIRSRRREKGKPSQRKLQALVLPEVKNYFPISENPPKESFGTFEKFPWIRYTLLHLYTSEMGEKCAESRRK